MLSGSDLRQDICLGGYISEGVRERAIMSSSVHVGERHIGFAVKGECDLILIVFSTALAGQCQPVFVSLAVICDSCRELEGVVGHSELMHA